VHVGSFGDALLAALVISAVSLVLQVILGVDDDDEYTLRVTRRIAKRQGAIAPTDVPGSSTWRSTASRCPCCATRCATEARRSWRA
jgi:hypothetical protein